MAGNGDEFILGRKNLEDPLPLKKEIPCDAVYERGYEYQDFDPRSYDTHRPCKIDMKNGVPPNTVTVLPPIDQRVFQQFLDRIPLLSADDIRDAPDGVYTWIVFSKYGGEKQFVACPVRDAFEIGVKHGAIAFRVQATYIHNGGELRKEGGTMRFNLQSGTYMQYWLKIRLGKAAGYCNHLELHAYVQAKFKDLFPSATFQNEPFKTGSPTEEGIKAYRLAGFRIVDVSGLSYDACNTAIDAVLYPKGGRKTRRRRRRYTRRARR